MKRKDVIARFVEPSRAKFDCIDPKSPYEAKDAINSCWMWKKNGSQGGKIEIQRSVRLLKKPEVVFFVHDYTFTSKGLPNFGARMNKNPITDFNKAVALVGKCCENARKQGWCFTEELPVELQSTTKEFEG